MKSVRTADLNARPRKGKAGRRPVAKSHAVKNHPIKSRARVAKSAVENAGESSAQDSRSVVNSLAKGLRVLEAFTAEQPEMSLSELARAADLDPGTAFRMLNTLVMLGYLSRVPDSRRFRLTLKVVDLGLHAIGRSDLRELARPILRSLVGETSEAASLGVLEGSDILYVERVRAGLTRLGVDIRIGTTFSACYSVLGKAILAFLPPRDVARILETLPSRDAMAMQPVSKADLQCTLEHVHREGYALEDSAFNNGLRILAAPVLDIDGYPVAAVSVAAPAVRLSMNEFRARALEPVRNAAKGVARAVQASGTISTAI